jgi:signal peptidase I
LYLGYWDLSKMPENVNMKSFLKEVIITLVLAVIIFIGARATIRTYEVFQSSMLPNFHEGQLVVVNKAAYWFGDPKRGDVVIIKAPNGDKNNWIKRIIGLPGDKVEILQGVTYINGIRLNEPYVKNNFTYSLAELTVPADTYFFLGDNRDVSNDSSKGWWLKREDIIGKAWLISWPPSDWKAVPKYDLNNQVQTTATPVPTIPAGITR